MRQKWEQILKALATIIRKLNQILRQQRPHFDYSIGLAIPKTEGGETMLELTITNEQKIPVTLNPKTSAGQPAPVENVTWEVLDGPSTVEPSPDGMTGTLISSDDPDTVTTFKVTADADMGEGVVPITDTVVLRVQHALAENLGLVAGDAVPK